VKNFPALFFLVLQFSCSAVMWSGTKSSPRPGDAGTPIISNPMPEPSDTSFPAENIRRREEYAVYDTVLENLFETGELQCIVLKDFTTARNFIEEEEQTLEYVRENLPEMPQAVWDNFISRNQTPVALEPVFHFPLPIILISQKEISGIFFEQEGDGWDRFYDNYRGAQGIMDISQAGFNPGFTRALVYAGDQSNYLAGVGFLYYLEKVGGSWNIRNSVMVWIS